MRELISVPTGREEYAPMTSLVQSLALAACGQNRAVFRKRRKISLCALSPRLGRGEFCASCGPLKSAYRLATVQGLTGSSRAVRTH